MHEVTIEFAHGIKYTFSSLDTVDVELLTDWIAGKGGNILYFRSDGISYYLNREYVCVLHCR